MDAEPIPEDGHVHVYPLFGREYELALACWCHPELDEEQPLVVIHNVEN